jgi:ketosteroid isomerase-like protein
MSQENVEIVRLSYDRLNRTGELNRNDYGDNAIFDASRLPGFGIYRGFDEFNAAWTQYRDTFDNWWIAVEELIDGKWNRVFAAARDGGRMRASGSEVRQQVFHVYQVREGKITAWTVFLERTDALEAVGLRE